MNGEVKAAIGENSFTIAGLFDAAEVPFADIYAIEFADYVVKVRTEAGDYVFSRMGSWAQPFYDALCSSYCEAVLRAFFVSGSPVSNAVGDYLFTENGMNVGGVRAPIRVYENCITALPPNDDARRIPLCFASGLERSEYGLTLKLSTGETYVFSRMGLGTAYFTDVLEERIRALRERSISIVKDIDPTLTVAQASQISKIMPEGIAAQIGQLAAIAPSFAAAVISKISQTRAAESYKAFTELCDPAQIWVGFKENDITENADPATGDGDPADQAPPDPYLFWMIAPSPNGQYAAVEFAVQEGESAATFVYRTNGDPVESAVRLNRALEAIDFKREVVRLSEKELRNPENADYFMAAKHTPSLQYIRANFAGRVIHSNPEAWKRGLTELWSAKTQLKTSPQPNAKRMRCAACGMELQSETKFCRSCGAKI
ncbi:MAG: hypothetical protein LBB30_04535 [Candidatus Methanoplasma sp.]|nr:hypothetical protein [Candidatus Methanoplasma sp.]